MLTAKAVLPFSERKLLKLPKNINKCLKDMNTLSTNTQCEYAGTIDIHNLSMNQFQTNTFVTSDLRNKILPKDIKKVWPETVCYHTHPLPRRDEVFCATKLFPDSVVTTLPSKADVDIFIKYFPYMQSNIICDSSGFYVIDILDAAENDCIPLPSAINQTFDQFRKDRFINDSTVVCNNSVYHVCALEDWKYYINCKLSIQLLDDGIHIKYYSYDDIAYLRYATVPGIFIQ